MRTLKWMSVAFLLPVILGINQCEPTDVDGDGWDTAEGDCDDGNAAVYPGAAEVCNAQDDDCDGVIDEDLAPAKVSATSSTTVYFLDADSDLYGDPDSPESFSCNTPIGYVLNAYDCDDSNAAVHPNAKEVCDVIDNDCDNGVDEDSIYYSDSDGDSWEGTPYTLTCEEVDPNGYYTRYQMDCDDSDSSIYPDAPESCDGIDNNCDTKIDESQVYYYNGDFDGYGDPSKPLQVACGEPVPQYYTDYGGDCDDTRTDVHPYAPELCDSLDNDCDTQVDECEDIKVYQDLDGDGQGNSYVTQTLAGYAYCTLNAPDGWSYNNDDCDDEDPTAYLHAEEVCDGVDNNCDDDVDEGGTYWYADNDLDAYGSKTEKLFIYLCDQDTIIAPNGWITVGGDCKDTDAAVNPGMPDDTCDGVDNDCDFNDGIDADNDSYTLCEADCNDANRDVHPGNSWIEQCNGIDDNCDGLIDNVNMYLDADLDGDGAENATMIVVYCPLPSFGLSRYNWDCNDANPAISGLNGIEVADDGIDSDCDGKDDPSGED